MLNLDHAYQKLITHLQTILEDLDIVVPIYNLLEYRDNYSMISIRLWNFCRDEVNDATNEIADNRRMKNSK